MLSKVEMYDLVDPVTDDTVGAFETEDFAQLYDQLTEKGMESLEAAFMVGGLIEELDILDLQRAIEDIRSSGRNPGLRESHAWLPQPPAPVRISDRKPGTHL